MDLTYFNPHSQSEADFLASFVARQDILDHFARQLRNTELGRPARHHLIVAPRGYGKTSLLRRIAIAARVDVDLRERYIALTFREEQHNVISLDVFWRNCLQSLLEAREDEGAPHREIKELEGAWERLTPRHALKRSDQDGDPASHDFLTRCQRIGRRPLLLIDNLDTLLEGLEMSHQWTLRSILQRDDGPMLIAAAPRYPESTHDQNAAFYEFFRVHTLNKLSDQEVMVCLRALALQRGNSGRAVLTLLDKEPGRIASLNTMAGGNPRTLSVLYSVLESHMSADVLSQLSAMLDTFTGWYQARTEEMPMQARAVFDALALNWDPIAAAGLSKVTGLETSTVSSQLSRLEKGGFVEAVSLSRNGKGRNAYQVSERFFNIWYLMRNGPRRAWQNIKFLTVFLQSCFSGRERRDLAMKALAGNQSDPRYSLALASSMRPSSLRDQLLEQASHVSKRLGQPDEYSAVIQELRWDGRNERGAESLRDSEQGVDAYDDVIRQFGDAPEPDLRVQVAGALVNKGFRLGQLGRSEQAIEVYDDVVARYGDAPESELRVQVAKALANKGFRLGQLGRSEQEIEVYDEVVTRFGNATEPELRVQVGRALVNKGITLSQLGRPEQAIEVYDEVVTRFGDATEPKLRVQVARALVNKGFRLGQLGRSEQAIEVYDEVVTRFGDATEPELRVRVARALVNKGFRLGQLGRSEQAIEVCDEVATRFGDDSEPELRVRVAMSLINKGITLGQLGRSEQEIEVCDEVVTRFGDAPEPELRVQVAMSLVNKGFRLGQLGQSEQEIEICDGVVARYGDAPEPELRVQVAMSLVNKGFRLGQLGRSDLEIEVYDGVVARYGDAPEPGLRVQVAMSLVNKGFRLGQLGRSEQAIEVYDDVVARYGDDFEPELRMGVAWALVHKGFRLGQLGRSEQEIEVYDGVVARFGDSPEPELRVQVAKSLANKGNRLGQLGQSEQAIEVYDGVVTRFGDAPEPELRVQVARALVNKGFMLGQLGRSEQEIEVCDEVVTRYGDDLEPEMRAGVARALVNKGFRLGQLGRSEQEIEVYDEVVTRFGDSTEPELRVQVGRALVNKGFRLGQLGRSEQEIEVCDEVVTRFDDHPEPELRMQVAMSLINKGFRLGQLGRLEQAIEVYDGVVTRFDDDPELELRVRVARALVNKGITLRQLGRSEQEIEVCDDVVTRFGAAPEPELRVQVARALVGKADSFVGLGRHRDAEDAYRRVFALKIDAIQPWASLGNLYLDHLGDTVAAINSFREGLRTAIDVGDRAVLHANYSYALALHVGDEVQTRQHVQEAIASTTSVSPAGRELLESLLCLVEVDGPNWPAVFDRIGRAVRSGDSELWSTYLDDIQRVLWFIVASGQGEPLRRWMENEEYPSHFAPLYHALVAAIGGEDHLLSINPETRQPATRIYEGISRRLRLHGKRE